MGDILGRYPAQTQVEHVLYKPPIFQTKTGPDVFQHMDGMIRSSDPAGMRTRGKSPRKIGICNCTVMYHLKCAPFTKIIGEQMGKADHLKSKHKEMHSVQVTVWSNCPRTCINTVLLPLELRY